VGSQPTDTVCDVLNAQPTEPRLVSLVACERPLKRWTELKVTRATCSILSEHYRTHAFASSRRNVRPVVQCSETDRQTDRGERNHVTCLFLSLLCCRASNTRSHLFSSGKRGWETLVAVRTLHACALSRQFTTGRAGRFLHPEISFNTHFCWGLLDLQQN
jgi:hypothetical protein